MKKRFTLEVMYGDADGYETFTHITEDNDLINLLTHFLEHYDEDMFDFYDRPDLLRYNKKYKHNEEKLIEVVNEWARLTNIINEKYKVELFKLLSMDAEKNEIHTLLSELLEWIKEECEWYMNQMDYEGCPKSYKIEDITGCIEITKEEAKNILKEKLGMNVVFID